MTTSVVRIQKRKGVIVTPWDVYIGPPLNNSSWSFDKTKWLYPYHNEPQDKEKWLELYKNQVKSTMGDSLHELIGKRLGCFCKDPNLCHGRVLAELANALGGDGAAAAAAAAAVAVQRTSCVMRTTATTVFFKGDKAIPSNLHPCNLQFHGKSFSCVHQAYAYLRSVAAHKTDLARKIMKAPDVKSILYQTRELSKQVRVHPTWDAYDCVRIMHDLIRARWLQDAVFRHFVETESDKHFVEATKDRFWGGGVDMSNLDADNYEPASGMNILGWLIKLQPAISSCDDDGGGSNLLEACKKLKREEGWGEDYRKTLRDTSTPLSLSGWMFGLLFVETAFHQKAWHDDFL